MPQGRSDDERELPVARKVGDEPFTGETIDAVYVVRSDTAGGYNGNPFDESVAVAFVSKDGRVREFRAAALTLTTDPFTQDVLVRLRIPRHELVTAPQKKRTASTPFWGDPFGFGPERPVRTDDLPD